MKCETCGGTGEVSQANIYTTKCQTCDGAGQRVFACDHCEGTGFGKMTASENIVIPKGVFNGCILKVKSKGNETNGGLTGDVLLKMQVEPSPHF